jgi:hypothetical protein
MKRFQFALTRRDYAFLRHEARRRRTSMSAVIRELIQDRIRARRRIPRDHPFRNIIGIGRGDGSPVSEKHDEYLYARPRGRY